MLTKRVGFRLYAVGSGGTYNAAAFYELVYTVATNTSDSLGDGQFATDKPTDGVYLLALYVTTHDL